MTMLYILPPPRTPNPPSPWESILSSGDGSTWKPPRVRHRNLPAKSDDGITGVQDDNMDTNRTPKSLSECYFAGKGTALVLPAAEAQKSNRRSDAHGSNIRKHLQSIVDLLRPEETLKMAVKLESVHSGRIRYLVIVSRMGKRAEESCLLGIDCNEKTTVGLVLKVMADTTIRLDGDGGFSVSVCSRHHIFKPVSVQAMWSALQTLHKVSSKAREQNYFQGGLSHDWVDYYERNIESDQSYLNEWHAMDNLESKRPPSPDSIRTKPTEREQTEKVIRDTLKEIMMSVDLDEVTSKYIRTRLLEEDLDMDLGEYKSFIDQEMLTILGQMDAPTEIFDHVYLGSEWNASNYEELQRNGIGHILNVTREIDNFFPGTFNYFNVRVCDDEKTDLLKYWDDTFRYITNAKQNSSKVLVHCKMGVSRSASVVIAYAMKAYNWDFHTALRHVKEKRTCIKPNANFLTQLETYQGILDAMKNKEKLQRSKSETNLKSPENKMEKIPPGSEPTPIVQILPKFAGLSGQDLRVLGARPKSWSPDILTEIEDRKEMEKSPISVSLEELSHSKESLKEKKSQARHVLMPCDNGESYSVSPNQILHLPGKTREIPSVKERVSELELSAERSPPTIRASLTKKETWDPGDEQPKIVQDSDEHRSSLSDSTNTCDSRNDSIVSTNQHQVWTCSTFVKTALVDGTAPPVKRKDDPFSHQVDHVFAKEEQNQHQRISETTPVVRERECPSRQSSWSSYDSAVVLPNDVGLSRHSSWGSGDNTGALPSRNSSWGSYDLRRPREEDVPWLGTVKRTKQKIEEKKSEGSMTKSSSSDTLYDSEEKPVEAINTQLAKNLNLTILSPSAISPMIRIPNDDNKENSTNTRLSVSAPEPSSMDLVPTDCSLSRSASNVSSISRDSSVTNASQCLSAKQHRTFVEKENLPNREFKSVQSLKKEFEAKICTKDEKKNKVNSTPSSPVSVHQDVVKVEEKNVKNLMGRFEPPEAQVTKRPKTGKVVPRNVRYSCLEVSKCNKNGAERPPISPVVRNTPHNFVESLIASATKKQQQYGKSHPLARLTIKPRHNNSVYNTM